MSAGWQVDLRGVTQRPGGNTVLDGVDVTFRPGVITGLIGRNGAGKSSLLRLVAGLRRPESGQVLVDDAPVWEDATRTRDVLYADALSPLMGGEKSGPSLSMVRMLRPGWHEPTFTRITERFGVPLNRRPDKLSTGQRAALSLAVALASRTEVTLLDEVHTGLDAVARRWLVEELLAEYTERPRTIVLCSHLLDEVEDLLEDVVVLHGGRVAAAGSVDDLRAAHTPEGGRLASLTDALADLTGDDR
ncbi:ATP-binding cassette domain-containing protein [Kytococcus sp. Marseille-QA3725]